MKIIYKTVYVDEGSFEPDEVGRWMMVGYLEVKTNKIKGYEWIGDKAHVSVCHIHMRTAERNSMLFGKLPEKYQFIASCPHFHDLDNGFSVGKCYAETLEELKEIIHERVERVRVIFSNCH